MIKLLDRRIKRVIVTLVRTENLTGCRHVSAIIKGPWHHRHMIGAHRSPEQTGAAFLAKTAIGFFRQTIPAQPVIADQIKMMAIKPGIGTDMAVQFATQIAMAHDRIIDRSIDLIAHGTAMASTVIAGFFG